MPKIRPRGSSDTGLTSSPDDAAGGGRQRQDQGQHPVARLTRQVATAADVSLSRRALAASVTMFTGQTQAQYTRPPTSR